MWRTRLICTACGKPDGPFRKEVNGRFGLSSRCSPCIKLKTAARLATPEGRASRMWALIKQRCGRDMYYANVSVTVSRTDFLGWAVPAVRVWMRKNPGKTPSIDRKDHDKDYSLDNIRVVSWGENSRTKPYNKTVNAPAGQAWCGACKQYLNKKLFSPRPGRSTGVQGRCKKCMAAYMRAHRPSRTRKDQ